MAGEHQSNPQLSQNPNQKQARERRQKRQRGHVTGIRPDAQWNGNATGSARRNRLVALGFFSLNFNFMLLLLVFSNPGNLNIIVTGVTAIATSRGRTHHDQRCRPAAINDGVIFRGNPHPFGGNAPCFSVHRRAFHSLPPFYYTPNNPTQLSHTLSSSPRIFGGPAVRPCGIIGRERFRYAVPSYLF